MLFSSSVFIFIFLPVVLIFYYLPIIKKRIYKNIVLMAASILFYAYGEPVYVLLMLASITVNWGLGLLIQKHREAARFLVITAAVINLGVLFCFKYLNFFFDNLGLLIGHNFGIAEIALPIGISFYTFQALSYVMDVYYKKTEAAKTWLKIGLYISCFPQLIAGPIVRYNTVDFEIDHRKESFHDVVCGLERFSIGLAKKVLFANKLAVVADAAFSGGADTAVMAWMGAIAYALQIYFDFSGYSDMAIGLGRMFGFHFSENFNYPYTAFSITDFWRRWHMSLTTWFKDYLYIPLGGNRKGKVRTFVNIFAVWLFTGLWHGANWTFIVWGLYFWLLQVLEKQFKLDKKKTVIGHIYTLILVLIGWVFFKADSLVDAIRYIGRMIGINAASFASLSDLHYLKNYGIWFICAIVLSLPVYKKAEASAEKNRVLFVILQILKVIMILVTISFVLSGEYDPFIYFNF